MEAPESVGDGHCVTDGPFSDLVLPFHNSDDHDHCLSRSFADGHTRGRLPGDQVRPAVVEEILSQADYKTFFLQLEKGPHNQIPNGIGGDFLKFTAPNDPLFFLHHRYVYPNLLLAVCFLTISAVSWIDCGGYGRAPILEHGSTIMGEYRGMVLRFQHLCRTQFPWGIYPPLYV